MADPAGTQETEPTPEAVTEALRAVIDPELGADIVDLGMVKSVTVESGTVIISVALTSAGCPLRGQIQRDAKGRISALPGVADVKIEWGVLDATEKAAVMDRARMRAAETAGDTAIPLGAKVLAIASGKGGVGKSSVTVNLACALALEGMNVGVIDADIWGFSIPRMLGIEGRLESTPATGDGDRPKIRPHTRTLEAPNSGRLDVVSMGMLVEDEESALLWRGLMLNRAVQHFFEDVAWADDLDYVLIDMPPGTGDVAMGLARMLPRCELIVVTTPAVSAQKVATRAVTMARRSHLRVVGVVENMSAFVAPDGQEYAVFGSGGGTTLATQAGVPLLGQIPIEAAVAEGSDAGEPAVLRPGAASEVVRTIAHQVLTEVAPPLVMESCSARMLDLIEAALDAADESA